MDQGVAFHLYLMSSVSFEAMPKKRAINVAITTTKTIFGSQDDSLVIFVILNNVKR